MRENDERFTNKIKEIIDNTIILRDGGCRRGGEKYIITNTDKAAKDIFNLMLTGRKNGDR